MTSINGTKVLALNSAGNALAPLKVDSNGLLRVIAEATSVSANAINLNTDGLEGLQTSTNSKLDTIDGVLDNAEAHLGNIDTGIDVLEACVGSNKVNVNISSGNITGFSTAANQSTIIGHVDGIETSLTAITGYVDGIEGNQATMIGHLDGVEGKLDTLETTLTAIETDQAAIEVLLTAANGKHAANETLLGTIDSDTDAIKTSTAACATDLAAIEVLLTAANTDHAANEVLLTGIDQKLGDIETAVQLIDDGYGTMTETTLLNASVGSSATTTSNVFTKPREITHAGISIVADTNGTYNAFIEYSVDNSTYFQGSNLNFSSNAENSGEIGTSAISSGYKYYRVRVANNHSGSQNFTVKICY